MITTELFPKNVRECHEEHSCALFDEGTMRLPSSIYDPADTSEGELLIAKQLIEDAQSRGISITFADLGVEDSHFIDVPLQATDEPSLKFLSLPAGIFNQVVVQ